MTMRSSGEFGETQFDVAGADAMRLAYIKPIDVAEARALGAIPKGIKLSKNVRLFALHAADGTRLAIMDNWAAAYGVALQNEFIPVSVH